MELKITALIGTVLISGQLMAQGLSEPYQPGIARDAVSYWLPRTQLTVTVNARKESFVPGEFSRYAERYLRMDDVKDKATETWQITGVTISSTGTPDKEQLYTLAFPAKGGRPVFHLTDDGILATVNAPYEPESDVPAPVQEKDNPAPGVNPLDYMTEEILMAGSTAKMAELTAKEIYSIRESRNSITRGQADFIPTDGESLKFMIESLNTQESALLSMFSGISKTEEYTFSFDIDPDEAISRQILFRFSVKLGVLPADNLAGEPVWIDITDKAMLKKKADVQASDSKKKKDKTANSLLYYRIPGRADVKVYNNRQILAQQDMQIAQLGNVEVIATSIMGKKADTQIVFDTSTGNVTSIR